MSRTVGSLRERWQAVSTVPFTTYAPCKGMTEELHDALCVVGLPENGACGDWYGRSSEQLERMFPEDETIRIIGSDGIGGFFCVDIVSGAVVLTEGYTKEDFSLVANRVSDLGECLLAIECLEQRMRPIVPGNVADWLETEEGAAQARSELQGDLFDTEYWRGWLAELRE